MQERKAKYQALKQGLQESGAKQVSLTDADARSLETHHNSTHVCYNVQTAVDARHQWQKWLPHLSVSQANKKRTETKHERHPGN
jgi:predicted aspartyl protease